MKSLILALAVLAAAVGGTWLTPWSRPRDTITVTGHAQRQINNQVARFNVSITQTNKDKQAAIEAVNQAMTTIVNSLKDFGIEAKDLTTQNVSVIEISEPEIMIYPPRPKSGEKQWQASNSLEVILRQVEQASALTDLLQQFPLAQVSGPNFSLEDYQQAGADLLTEAVEDAREKAGRVAAAAGRKLGKVVTVAETASTYPLYRDLVGLNAAKETAPAPVEPGSSQTSKAVTVVFELK